MDAAVDLEENNYKIMIVEDESIVAMDLSYQLEQMGYEVCAIEDNGLAAIKSAKKYQPDLIMMDIVIKGDMDGIQTAANINHQLKIPIVFLTAFNDDNTVNRATKTAPYGYISKPYNPKEIQATL
ncbi:MAG: response regulator [Bacteroidia bacterium]|nr:response regulator [Methylotenera sp.]